MYNSQNDGLKSLQRIEFEFKGKSYMFTLNPEEYEQTEPHRIQVTQTKGGAFIDDFGAGVTSIYFAGTTGFKGTTADPTYGFNKFKELRDLIRDTYSKTPPGSVIDTDNELIFHNYTDGEHWVVTPKVFSLKRSIARPLLYLYTVHLICERRVDEPMGYIRDANQSLVPVLIIPPVTNVSR